MEAILQKLAKENLRIRVGIQPNRCIRLIWRIVLEVPDVAFNDIPRFAVETH
jgi:hypothetical protein